MPAHPRLLFLLAVLAGVPACGGPPRALISDHDAMQGRWVMTDGMFRGEKTNLPPKQMELIF